MFELKLFELLKEQGYSEKEISELMDLVGLSEDEILNKMRSDD